MSPTEFEKLLEADLIDSHLLEQINEVQLVKADAAEGFLYTPPAEIKNWIETQFDEITNIAESIIAPDKCDRACLDELFFYYLKV